MTVSLEEIRNLLGRLIEARGVAGFEDEKRTVFIEEIQNYAERIPYQLNVATVAWYDTSMIHLTRGGVPS
ncbi:MAG: hypothetical protein ACE5JS_06650 [Nitrospinota bacterium]